MQRSVFRVLTSHDRQDVDWSFEDNQAGYYTWIRSFDELIDELIEDGHVSVEVVEATDERTLVPVSVDDPINFSQKDSP